MARYAELSDEAIAEFNEAIDWYTARSQHAALGLSPPWNLLLKRSSLIPADSLPHTLAVVMAVFLDTPFS
jgi:hypothetical protein